MMTIPPEHLDFWLAFTASTNEVDDGRFYESFAFGDSESLGDELASLVLSGVKQASAGAYWTFEIDEKPLPTAGALSIVTNWAGKALCIIETINVEILPFHQVTADFAAAEGAADGSLANWRSAHRAFFTRECKEAARAFDESMLIVCERFKVVY